MAKRIALFEKVSFKQFKEGFEDCFGESEEREIKEVYDKTGYVLDTHTAVASKVRRKYAAETGDGTKTMIASTASPYKFTRSVMNAIDIKYDSMSDFELVDELNRISGVAVPRAIEEIRTAPVLHDTVVEVDDMKDTVKKFLGI